MNIETIQKRLQVYKEAGQIPADARVELLDAVLVWQDKAQDIVDELAELADEAPVEPARKA